MGIPIEYVHHEVGPSHEIDMRLRLRSEMADTITYRLIVKEIAKKAGFPRDLHAEADSRENGSGMHTHMSLFTPTAATSFVADRTQVAPVRHGQGVLSPDSYDMRAKSQVSSRSGSTPTSGSCRP